MIFVLCSVWANNKYYNAVGNLTLIRASKMDHGLILKNFHDLFQNDKTMGRVFHLLNFNFFSVFCPHASFLSPPVAQPRSCQTSFSHLCALPLTLDFMALFLPQGPAFWKEGCFLHQAHHQNHLGVFIKTRNALPKTEVPQCLLETLIHGPGGGQGTRSFFV